MEDNSHALASLLLPDILTVEDLAPRLRRSPSSVRALLRSGLLPGRKLGRRWIIERGALVRALAPERGLLPLRVLPVRPDGQGGLR